MNILNSINSPDDIMGLSIEELEMLADEIRAFLIENVSKTGGHLASNLGAVELTLALHRVYNTEKDRLVFDVGHQSYVHKIITGRKNDFSTLRQLNGLSGFPKPSESIHDAAIAGHASDSVSIALGMARARTINNDNCNVAALIGDGALTGGLAYEGLCDAGASDEPMVIILNDNGMSIDCNVGSISDLLKVQRVKPQYFNFKRKYRQLFSHVPSLYNFNHSIKEWLKRKLLPGNIFSDLGFHYLGPVDGHNLVQLEAVLRWAKELNCPVLVHVITQKGRGYSFAEVNPECYHGVGAFNAECGVKKSNSKNFSNAFGSALTKIAEKDDSIVAITAAMCDGTGLSEFSHEFPNRFFDVGIAEGHAVSMAAGMSAKGLTPVFAVYSSFLQRGFDMLIHDVSLSKQHVVFAVDRSGIVGRDGETHQGVFDISFLRTVPNMVVLSPASYEELQDMINIAFYRYHGPIAIRYPRGGEGEYKESAGTLPVSKLSDGTDITIVTYGILINNVLKAAQILKEKDFSAEAIKINLIKPLNSAKIIESVKKTGKLLIVEDVCAQGCIGQELLAEIAKLGLSIKASCVNLGDGIVQHGSVDELLELYNLDAQGIADAAEKVIYSDGERIKDEKNKA